MDGGHSAWREGHADRSIWHADGRVTARTHVRERAAQVLQILPFMKRTLGLVWGLMMLGSLVAVGCDSVTQFGEGGATGGEDGDGGDGGGAGDGVGSNGGAGGEGGNGGGGGRDGVGGDAGGTASCQPSDMCERCEVDSCTRAWDACCAATGCIDLFRCVQDKCGARIDDPACALSECPDEVSAAMDSIDEANELGECSVDACYGDGGPC